MSTHSPKTLQIVVEPVPARDITLLRLSGPLDSRTDRQLEQALQAFFKQGLYKIILDLNEVPHISSAGCSVLVNALAEAQSHHGDIVFIHLNEATCGTALKLIGLWDILKIAENLTLALTLFGHASSSSLGKAVGGES